MKGEREMAKRYLQGIVRRLSGRACHFRWIAISIAFHLSECVKSGMSAPLLPQASLFRSFFSGPISSKKISLKVSSIFKGRETAMRIAWLGSRINIATLGNISMAAKNMNLRSLAAPSEQRIWIFFRRPVYNSLSKTVPPVQIFLKENFQPLFC